MPQIELQTLLEQFRAGDITRRHFMRRAGALGMSAAAADMLATNASAQEATPGASPVASASPAGIGETITSVTRAEYYEQLKSHFALTEPERRGGTLIHTYTIDISTLNPILTSDIYSGLVISFLFEGLVSNSPIDGSVVPSGIADSWEIAPDGVTYTFYLNPNATWHDGEPVTADDVIFTFDAVMAEDSPSVRRGTVAEFLAGYEKIDDHTLTLVSKQQSAVFLENTALQFAIVPKHIWEDVPVSEWPSDSGSTGQDPARVVGSGPFRFVEWTLGSQVRLERNPDYWDQDNVPEIDEYVFNVVQDTNTQIASLQNGETDVTGISSTRVDTLRESNPEIQIAEVDTSGFTYYVLNQNEADLSLFVDKRVRQALHYAIDRDTYVEAIQMGYAVRADGTQPVLSPAYAPERMNTIYDFDPDRAKALLDEAGWVEGTDGIREKDGERLSFELMFSEGVESFKQGIPFIQQHWRDVGVEVIPAEIPFPTLWERVNNGEYESAILGFTWDYDGAQGAMFRCDQLPPTGFNMMHYCNEEYDELDLKAQSELDHEKRVELLIQATNIANDDMAAGVFFFSKALYGASPRVRNFLPQGYSGYWWVRYAWLEDA